MLKAHPFSATRQLQVIKGASQNVTNLGQTVKHSFVNLAGMIPLQNRNPPRVCCITAERDTADSGRKRANAKMSQLRRFVAVPAFTWVENACAFMCENVDASRTMTLTEGSLTIKARMVLPVWEHIRRFRQYLTDNRDWKVFRVILNSPIKEYSITPYWRTISTDNCGSSIR